MTRPTPEYLIETMKQYSINIGHQKLRSEGYQISRDECQRARKRLWLKGEVKFSREVWTNEMVDRVRELAAQSLRAEDIGKAMGRTTLQVYNLVRRTGIPLLARQGPPIRQAPPREELEAVFNENSMASIANIFETTPRVVKRWLTEYGITRPILDKKQPVRKKAKKSPRNLGLTWTPIASVVAASGEYGPAAEAARYLRIQGYSNVYRINHREWQVGSRPMSEADMLARVDEMKARRARLAGSAA